MDKLKKLISQAKDITINIRNQREASVYDKTSIEVEPPFNDYPLTDEVSQIFKYVKAITLQEKNVYSPSLSSDMVIEPLPENKNNQEHGYVQSFKETIQITSIYDYPENLLKHYKSKEDSVEGEEEDLTSMTPSELSLYKIVSAELAFANENMVELGYNIATLNKMTTAVDSIALKRTKDAVTVLKTAKKNDPNNRSLAFILSQLLYFRVQNGSSEALPEARAEAKKSCLYSESCNAQQLRQYRYAYVLQECNFDPAKAVDLMREFYLLNPESMTEGNGIGAHGGIHLKAWMLLSTLDPKLLTSFEIESLEKIATTAPGGAIFYLNVMRPQLRSRFESEKDIIIQKLFKLEILLARSYANYSDIVATIQQNYDDEGNLTPNSKYLWTLEHRYTSLLLKSYKIPAFDEVYLYTSLDAKRYSTEAYPNRAMAAMGLANVNYWQVWSIVITGVEGKGSSRTLPVKRMAAHTEIFCIFDKMLEALVEVEKEIIPDEKWKIIKKYMPKYEYNIFIHVAAGPDAFKVPSNPYYLNFYRAWVKVQPSESLPSEILKAYAEKGNFIDAEEVVAAFEGALRVMTDDVHGLKSRAKDALKACLGDKKNVASSKAKDLMREGHFNDYWWLYVIVLPLAALAFYVMSGSGGTGSVIVLLVIILFAAGLGYAMYSISTGDEGSELPLDDEDKQSLNSKNDKDD